MLCTTRKWIWGGHVSFIKRFIQVFVMVFFLSAQKGLRLGNPNKHMGSNLHWQVKLCVWQISSLNPHVVMPFSIISVTYLLLCYFCRQNLYSFSCHQTFCFSGLTMYRFKFRSKECLWVAPYLISVCSIRNNFVPHFTLLTGSI